MTVNPALPTMSAKLERKPRTKPKCSHCRNAKKSCVFTHDPWPAPCDGCFEKKRTCPEPKTVPLTQNNPRPANSPRDGSQYPSRDLPHHRCIGLGTRSASNCDPNMAYSNTPATIVDLEVQSKQAILLLSLHSILLMAIKDMIEMAVVMLRPYQRHPTREMTEDNVPALWQAVERFKGLAYQVRKSMLSAGGGEPFVRAQDAINALATPCFLPEFAWGIDSFALQDTRASLTHFFNEGHYSLVYVLQVKLLQVGVSPTSDEVARLLHCKQQFMQQLHDVMASGNLTFALPYQWIGCQMFAPRELVRLPAMAMHILKEGRPDILGRRNFHILSDAGVSIIWERSGKHVGFLAKDGAKDIGTTMWPIEALDSPDILRRTALHIAVRQGSISSVKALSRSGADMHLRCLNGLSLLHIAACHGHANIVHHLIDKMHYHKCVEECYKLVDTCQEINIVYLLSIDERDGLGRSPFWYAARASHFEVMTILVTHIDIRLDSGQRTVIGANPELPDLYGQNAASIAARDGRVNVLKYLLGIRGKSWISSLESLMINEHLLLAYAVQSKNRECVKMVLAQRQWRFGGPVWMRASQYADEHSDEDLRCQLLNLYRSDEAIRTTQPLTGLTSHTPMEISGVDYSTDLSTFKTQLPTGPKTPVLGNVSVDQVCEAGEPSGFQTIDAAAMQGIGVDDSIVQDYNGE